MRFLPLLVLLLACAGPQRLKSDLEAMFDSDQAARARMEDIRKTKGDDSPEMRQAWDQQRPLDGANIARLEEIIAAHGWPGKSRVGDKASAGAFLVLQHAELPYQKKHLPLLRKAAAAGELRPDHLALLEDRILMREEKKQRYGSQLKSNAQGILELYPIEDEAHVDERRKSVGLPPMAEYLKFFGLDYPAR